MCIRNFNSNYNKWINCGINSVVTMKMDFSWQTHKIPGFPGYYINLMLNILKKFQDISIFPQNFRIKPGFQDWFHTDNKLLWLPNRKRWFNFPIDKTMNLFLIKADQQRRDQTNHEDKKSWHQIRNRNYYFMVSFVHWGV